MSRPNVTNSHAGFVAFLRTFVAAVAVSCCRAILMVAALFAVMLCCILWGNLSRSALAQTAARNGELRALFAGPLEIAEGKKLAESTCAGCHGANGISTTPGIPNLAGQRAAYLYLELQAYRSGVRGESAMNNAVRFLNEAALLNVAAYYASLDPAEPSAAAAAFPA